MRAELTAVTRSRAIAAGLPLIRPCGATFPPRGKALGEGDVEENMKNEQMALLVSDTTPHIQKYHGKTLVIKYGGNAMVNDDL